MQSENCNHNVNDFENTSIYIDQNKKVMVFPIRYMGVCLKCGKGFEYNKENGKHVEV